MSPSLGGAGFVREADGGGVFHGFRHLVGGGHVEHFFDRPVRPYQRYPTTLLAPPTHRAHDLAQAARVHEPKAAKIEHQEVRMAALDLVEPLAKEAGAGQ